VLLGALSLALTLATAPSRGETLSTTARPHNVKLFINGNRQPLLATGADEYKPFRARTLNVEARWTTNARGSGHYVVVTQGEPLGRTLARCTTGTSCKVRTPLPLAVGQEMTLSVKVLKKSNGRIVTTAKACLVGRR